MSEADHAEPALRVERGRADAEELAALMAVLLAVRAGETARCGHEPRSTHRWRRPDDYRAPHSWR
ncbi:acyl-CoA carboxylase epsilon subunit [Streptomyces sp. NPDC052043]|uniref:acyl-CoA carboxylase epsilon subunit n=1 Tax=Streptomyces sp. NPDC052043 TaxID=3365684 RepID=UPI0037D4293C